MIEILQEVTDWGKYKVANGVYHVNSAGHLVQHNAVVYDTPIKSFSKARRKFKKIGERPEELESGIIEVQGSNGNVYLVDTINKTCTCPGFTFRGNCKHVKAIL